MNSRIWILIAFLAIVSAAFLRHAQSSKSAAAQRPRPKKEVVKVRRDLDWGNLSEAELRKFSSQFGDAKSPTNFNFETVVAPGETILADVYEGRPGEFVFSKMTPTLKMRDDGTAVVAVAVESFGLSMVGGEQDIVSYTQELASGSAYTRGSPVEGGLYSITLSAEFEESVPSIRIKAAGAFHKPQPVPPP